MSLYVNVFVLALQEPTEIQQWIIENFLPGTNFFFIILFIIVFLCALSN